MIESELCRVLGIEYPVLQGGMAWVADGALAAAVSNGGGLGIIAAGSSGPGPVREQIRTARELTDKPFGVNIMLMSPHADEIAGLVAEEKVSVVAPGFIATDMTAGFDENNALVASIPLGRMGTPDDVAELAAFLADRGSDYITGEIFRVDGGIAM